MSDPFTRFVRKHDVGFVEGDDGGLFKHSTKRRSTHMTYLELVSAVRKSNPNDLESEASAKRVVDTVFSIIKNETKDGGYVAVRGFGAFAMRDSRTTGQTPDGQKWKKPANKALRFQPFKAAGHGAAGDKLIKDVSAPSAAPGETQSA